MDNWLIILIVVGAIALVIILGLVGGAMGRPIGRLSAECRQHFTLHNGHYVCNDCQYSFPTSTNQRNTTQMRRHLSIQHAPQQQPPAAAAININIHQQQQGAPAANDGDGANWLARAAEWVRHCCC
jgi:hypothetical protein